MVQFARPYRRILAWFLVLVVIEAVVGVINPLLFASIIDNGIKHNNKGLVIGLALVAAGLAIADTGLPRKRTGNPLSFGRNDARVKRCPKRALR